MPNNRKRQTQDILQTKEASTKNILVCEEVSTEEAQLLKANKRKQQPQQAIEMEIETK